MNANFNIPDVRERLSRRLHQSDIQAFCHLTEGDEYDARKELLYHCIGDADERISYNALWIFSHFSATEDEWLQGKQAELIDLAMHETHKGKQRLLLTLLCKQVFEKENLRSDFLDFCFAKITASAEAYAARALCIKLAYKQCRHYPELLDELKMCLEMLEAEPLSAGIQSCVRNTWKMIGRL